MSSMKQERAGPEQSTQESRATSLFAGRTPPRIFVTAQAADDPDPFRTQRWGVRPQVQAGDVVLFFIRRAGLAYAARAASSAVQEKDDRWASAELDEKSWHRLDKPLPVEVLQKLPELAEWPVLPRLSRLDALQPGPLEEPILSALVRAIEQRNPGFLEWLAVPPPSTDDLLFSRLDASSRDALGRADGIRTALSEDRIHMEHLLLGLFGEEDGYPRQFFRQFDVDEAELFELVASGKGRPTHYDQTRLTGLPVLSGHARQALVEADAVAADGRLVQPRDLLDGALSVSDCSVTERLRARGISREPRDRVDWVMDTPAREDRLGRKPFAGSLALRLQRINNEAPTRSFLVHIDGAWGSGKSTLLEFLQEELQQRGFVPVELNAWREQRIGPPWWSLLTALRRKRREDAGRVRRFAVWFQDLSDRLRGDWVPFATAMFILVGLAVGVFFLVGPDLSTAGARAESIASILGLAISVVGGSIAATRFLLLGSAQAARVFVKASDNPMQGIVSQFGRTLGRIGKPVVFFIDDLDRCSEAYVVEFLEAVQTLIRDTSEEHPNPKSRRPGGPYFVVAADGRWIRVSYEKGYETFGLIQGAARPLGSMFLDKIFHLTVRLPRITDDTRAGYLAWLLGQRSELTGKERIEEDAKIRKLGEDLAAAGNERQTLNVAERVQELKDPLARLHLLGNATVKLADRSVEAKTVHALQPFARFLDPNPRTIKRFVNAYGVLRAQRTLEAVFVATGPLALWTILELRWPVLAEYLRARPEQVSEVGAESPNVHEDLREVFRDRDQEVGAVVKDPTYGPLTPELVKQCGGPPS